MKFIFYIFTKSPYSIYIEKHSDISQFQQLKNEMKVKTLSGITIYR